MKVILILFNVTIVIFINILVSTKAGMSYFEQWFKDVCKRLQQSGKLKKLDVEFNQQTNDFGRVSVFYKHRQLGTNIDKCYSAKCNEKSEKFRGIGNTYYSTKEFNKAISSYSSSISYGNENSKELSLAYANRSVVLYAIKEYLLSQCDINLAFQNGYPSNLHYKLYERLGRCYMELGNMQFALDAFKDGLSSLKESGLDIGKKNELVHVYSELSSKCQCQENVTEKNHVNVAVKNYVYMVAPPVIPNDDVNKIYPCASKAFSIIDNQNEGRHAVASRNIPIGEVIIVEKPFTSICLSSCLETHCYDCLLRFKVSYPCRSCASVKFCSVECENKCWNSFHQYECKYFDLFTHDDIGLGHLALKMIIKTGFAGLVHFAARDKVIKISGKEMGRNENGIFEPFDYNCVYSLIGNSDLRKPSDLFRRSLIAIYMCNILCHTGFINEGVNLDDEYCLVGSHLLKQIQMLPCNAHEVSELQLEGNEMANSELKEIGSAVYTTLSLLNHSCDPSVVRHCYGDVCVLRSMKYIKQGEPIIDNYGHLYPVEGKADRQKNLLEQYYFNCMCIPCMQDWPLYNDIIQEDPKMICCNCGGSLEAGIIICPKCNNKDPEIADFGKLETDYRCCMENVLNTGEYIGELPILLKYLNLLSRKGQLPVIHFNNCQEIVKLCFGLQGNYVHL